MRIARTLPLLAAAPLVLAVGLPSVAHAKSGEVERRGSCTAGATWKLKAHPDDGRLEVEAEVDANVSHRTWTWSLRRNGVLVAKGTARTAAPSGSFEVRRLIANPRGTDTVSFRARRAGTLQTCSGSLRI